MQENVHDYIARRIARTQPELAWAPERAGSLSAWQNEGRKRVSQLLGIARDAGSPVTTRVLETVEFPRFTRQALEMELRDGLSAFAYLLTPPGGGEKLPAVLCLHGHGRGVDKVVGIAEDGVQKTTESTDYTQPDFALQCVERGYAALALEQISFGRRRNTRKASLPRDDSSCLVDSMAALMLGETMIGWRVWDAMRAIDYLRTLPLVDPDRIAVMGQSGGGMTAFWSACMDERIMATVVTGYFNTFQGSILSVDHCACNYVPGILRVMEMPDMAGLIAPRSLFVAIGREDHIFPVGSFRQAVARVQEIYSAFDASDHFEYQIFEGGHRFHGENAFLFLERQFKKRVGL